ncbi:MAG: hypothetical protein RLZZ336_831 [Cyanobacteriota bacterium]
MEPSSARSETAQQLEGLRAKIATGNPEHYRHWALYLQVLRECLTGAVDRCCFHLAVEVYPNRYRQLSAESRAELHQRIASLVHRCSSLLTVEQLLALAAQQRRRRQRLARRHQRRWLASLQQEPTAVFESAAPAAPQAGHDPVGSVHLGMGLPISLDLFAPSAFEASSEPDGLPQSAVQPDPPEGELEASDLMQAFARLLDSAEDLDPDPAAAFQAPPTKGLLPSHPLQLLRWMDELDGALARRLRNLSHGLNVELVRLGLCPTLPPLQLLEAVAAGQLETQNAPLNLVRLNGLGEQLPAAVAANSLAVLLRPADLESDQPRLRTCRSRLRQVRLEVRRMAQTYHRLERRLQALEAEQLWLHDHATARIPRTRQPD